ncbi:hypothetical protein, partial [Xanthomonas citri]|uniref:hypothetical protein n=1 Tax=Xanthomonas citri TaxID=346 RepID=UPI001CA53776
TGDGADALYALPRERFAHGKQLSWLRDRANQVMVWMRDGGCQYSIVWTVGPRNHGADMSIS